MSKILAQGMITLTQLYEGAQVILTPTAVLIPCDSKETPKSNAYTNAFTNVKAFLGTMDITSKITLGTLEYSDSTVRASKSGTKVSITAITTRTGYVDIPVSVAIDGETINLGKHRFSFVKQIDGQTGQPGQPGIPGDPGFSYTLNIKGGTRGIAYAANGTNPEPNTSSQFSVELLKNGVKVSNPASISWTCGGNLSGSSSAATFTPTIKSAYTSGSSYVKVSIKEFADSLAVEETIPIICTKHADGLDWINEWNGKYVQVGTEKIITPKIFAGTKSSSNELTGVAIGRDVLGGNTNKVIGIVGYKKNTPVFSLDQDANFFVSSSGSAGDIKNGTNNVKGLYFDGNDLYVSGKVKISGGSTIGENNTLVEEVINNSNLGAQANNKLDNLSIGGRNLIRKADLAQNNSTATYDGATNTWTVNAIAGAGGTWGCGLVVKNGNALVPYGKAYVLSFEIKVPRACSWNCDVNNYASTGSNWAGNDNDNTSKRTTSSKSLVANQWIKCWIKWENTNSNNTNKVDIYDNTNFGVVMKDETSNITYQIRNVKGELGNVPTEWTPAPEDIQADIDKKANSSDVYKKTETYTKTQTDSAIEVAKDEINLGISSTYETKTNVESKISTANTTTLNSAKSYADTKKSEAITQAGKEADSKVNSAKNELNTAINKKANSSDVYTKSQVYTKEEANSQIKVVKDEINLGVSNTYETKANVETKVSSTLNSAKSYADTKKTEAINSAASDAANKVNSAKNELNTKINDIQVGGRNLWIEKNLISAYESSGNATSSTSQHKMMNTYTDLNGAKYVAVQLWNPNSFNNTSNTNRIAFYDSNKTWISSVGTPKPNGTTYVSGIITVPTNAKYMKIGMVTGVSQHESSVKIKVELGNKATGWSPAPEDVTADITNAKTEAINSANSTLTTTIANYYTKEQTNSQINVAKEAINLGVSNTYETKANVETKVSSTLNSAKSYADTKKNEAISSASTDATNKVNSAKNELNTAINKKANSADVYTKSEVYTKSQTDSAINVAKDAINLSVSNTYETKTNVTSKIATAKSQAITDSRSVQDTRNTNQNPSWYFTNYPKQTITEFKYANVIGIGTSSVYGTLETKVPWADSSGGYPVQIFRSQSTPTYERKGTSATAWSAWVEVESTTGSQAKANAVQTNLNAFKGTVYTKSEVYTKTQTDSAINVAKDAINLSVSNTYETKTNVTNKINSANTTTLNSAKSYADTKKNEAISTASTDATNKVNSAKTELNNTINNISIGGRNLALGTSNNFSAAYTSFGGGTNICPSLANVLTDGLKVGDVVTVRLVYKYDNIVPASGQTAQCWIQGSGDVTQWNSGSFHGSNRITLNGSGQYTFLYNFTINADHLKNSKWGVNIRHDYVQSGSVQWKLFKVERGNKPTDWCRAVEDIYTKSEVYTKTETNSQISATTNAITSRVSSLESTTSSLNGTITNHENRLKTAENKITDSAIINTVSSTIQSAKNEAINSANTNTTNQLKNYATTASLTQTANSITAKFTSTGGYNLLKNSDAKNGTYMWNGNGKTLTIGTSGMAPFLGGNEFKSTFPNGIKYNETIKLKPDTEYVYEGWIYTNANMTGNATAPLHFWCRSEPDTPGHSSLTILDYRQDLTANKFNKCYVHFRTAGGNVYFTPFVYGGGTDTICVVRQLSLREGKTEMAWTPHPSEIYEGSTVIDASGVTVNNGALRVKDGSGNTMLEGDSSGTLYLRNRLNIGNVGSFSQYGIDMNSGSLRIVRNFTDLAISDIITFNATSINFEQRSTQNGYPPFSTTIKHDPQYGALNIVGGGGRDNKALYVNGYAVMLDGNSVSPSNIYTSKLESRDSMYNSIQLRSHNNDMWFRSASEYFTFQCGTGGDNWTQSFGIRGVNHPAEGQNQNWIDFGQMKSNAWNGSYRGVSIRKYVNGGATAGDLVAGRYYLTGSENAYITNHNNTGMLIQGAHGSFDVGARDSTYCYLNTDRNSFHLCKQTMVSGNVWTPASSSGVYGFEPNRTDVGRTRLANGSYHGSLSVEGYNPWGTHNFTYMFATGYFYPNANQELGASSGTGRWGQIYSTKGSVSTSDSRVKENIKPIAKNSKVRTKNSAEGATSLDMWNYVKDTKTYTFNYKTKYLAEGAKNNTMMGILADEIPDAVFANIGLMSKTEQEYQNELKRQEEFTKVYEEEIAKVPAILALDTDREEATKKEYDINGDYGNEIIEGIGLTRRELKREVEKEIEEPIRMINSSSQIAMLQEVLSIALNKIELLEEENQALLDRLQAIEKKLGL